MQTENNNQKKRKIRNVWVRTVFFLSSKNNAGIADVFLIKKGRESRQNAVRTDRNGHATPLTPFPSAPRTAPREANSSALSALIAPFLIKDFTDLIINRRS